MKSLLIIDNSLHHKNKIGLELMLQYLKCDYKYGTIQDINDYEYIYSPSNPINSSKYPDKKFIFGPHFSVFPNRLLLNIKNIKNNSVYIQPSKWAVNVWKLLNAENYIPLKVFPFPVNIDTFKPDNNEKKDKVFIYFKRRKPDELSYIETILKNKNIDYKIFDYVKRYNEKDYIKYLQQSKYGIILDAHESQGFAIEEALSCNVPLLVWNTKIMSQEYGSRYPDIPCNTIPYWSEKCGDFFYEQNEFENKLEHFLNKSEQYEPRKYILDNLSVEKCANNFIELLKSM